MKKSPNSNLKIMQCIASMGPGGTERQAAYLCEELVKKGLEVHVILLYTDGPNFQRLKNSGAYIHKISVNSNYSIKIIWQLLRLMRKIRPHIIQTWLTQMDVLGGIAAHIFRIPHIISERSSALAYPGNWKDRLRLFIGKHAAAVVSNSESGKDYWMTNIKATTFKAKNRVIPNGLPLPEIQASKADLIEIPEIKTGDPLIVFAGRLSLEKNLFILASALEKVFVRLPHSKAVFFGDGPLKDQIISLKEKLRLDGRLILKPFSTSLWGWLKLADVCTAVSTFEGHPNVVLEAIACNTVTVVSDIPAHREFLNEETAYIVDHTSPDGIAEAIVNALSDRETARKKADSALDIVCSRSVERATEDFIQLYQKIITPV